MNYQELMSFIRGTNSLQVDECKVLLTLQTIGGKTVLNVDLFTNDFENYDNIQQFLVEREVDFFEHPFEENAIITHFNMDTQLSLFHVHGDEGGD